MSSRNNLIVLPYFIVTVTLLVGAHSSISTTHNRIKNKINSQLLMNNLHNQIKAKEEEIENAEAINRNFERMIQLVNILGQVDNFLSERTKAVIKKLALLVEDEEEKRRYKNDFSEEEE